MMFCRKILGCLAISLLFAQPVFADLSDRLWDCSKQVLLSEESLQEQTDLLIKVFSKGAKQPITQELARPVIDDVWVPLMNEFEPRLKKAQWKMFEEVAEQFPDIRAKLESKDDLCEWRQHVSVDPNKMELPFSLRQQLNDKELLLRNKMRFLVRHLVESGEWGQMSRKDADFLADTMTAYMEAMPEHLFPVMQDIAKAFDRKMTAFNKPQSVKNLMKAVGR